MNDDQLTTDIRLWLHLHAQGAENAKPRRLLLAHLCTKGHWPRPDATSDRAMRKTYETMELVGSHSKGIFWIATAEDRRIAQGQLHGRAMSELVREKRIRDAGDMGQMELF